MARYKSDIILGDVYREKHTKIEGKAIGLYFYENACERVALLYAHDGEVKEAAFDAVELIHVKSEKPATSDRPGGPSRGEASLTRSVSR